MKSIVVYYSRTGNTKKVAELLSKELSCPSVELIDLTNRKGPLAYLTGGMDAVKKKLTKIEPINKDISKYDLVIIGTPNWGSTITPAIRTFLAENKKSIKQVAFFCTSGGENPGHIFLDFEELTTFPKATLSLRTSEIQTGNYTSQTKEFVKELK